MKESELYLFILLLAQEKRKSFAFKCNTNHDTSTYYLLDAHVFRMFLH